MTAKPPHPARSRRTAIAVGVAAALTGILAACGHSGASTAAHPAAHPAASRAAAAATPRTQQAAGTASTLHMVTNHGHRIAFHVTAGHQPAIVLDAGGGLDSSSWTKVVPELAARTGSEIITYDRAGMGASDPVPGPWKAQDAVSDLEAGLTALGATHHVVLVAHSEAGEIATYVTGQHPDQFAGAVLVDAALPQFSTDTEIARVAAATQAEVQQIEAKDPASRTRADRQLLAVAADYAADQRAYHRAVWPATVPANVIVSAQTPFPTSAPDAKAWRAAQQEFTAGAPNRHLVTAARSSHDIPVDRPDVVVAQIEAMLDATS